MNKKTVEDVGNIVGTEGLGYAVEDYLNANNIENEELSELWKNAQIAMGFLRAFLYENLGEDFFDNF